MSACSLFDAPDAAPALYLRLVAPLRGPVSPDEARLEHAYTTLVLTSDRARGLLAESACALESREVSGIAIKGAGHTLRLHTSALPRRLSDLDLVVHERDLDRATGALRVLGYEPEPWNGPEDVLLQAQEGPGLRCLAPGRLPVDLQTRLPGLPAHGPALEESWAAARPAAGLLDRTDRTDQPDPTDPSEPSDPSGLLTSGSQRAGGLLVLHPLHELLVAAAHFCGHLKPPLTVSPKWITDMLLMVHRNATGRHPRIGPPVEGATFQEKLAKITLQELIWPFADAVRSDPEPGTTPGWAWQEFWETAGRWGVTRECGIAAATMNAHWNAAIPGVPPDSVALPIERLFCTGADHSLHSAASVPAAYGERIARLRALPGAGARFRYLVSLVAPSESSLRHRYGVPEGAWIGPYRVIHPIRTAWKLARGLAAAAILRARRKA